MLKSDICQRAFIILISLHDLRCVHINFLSFVALWRVQFCKWAALIKLVVFVCCLFVCLILTQGSGMKSKHFFPYLHKSIILIRYWHRTEYGTPKYSELDKLDILAIQLRCPVYLFIYVYILKSRIYLSCQCPVQSIFSWSKYWLTN